MPWKLIADPSGYIFKWLLGYSGGLGSIAGVLICDYWFVRRRAARPRRSLPPRRRVRVRARGTNWRGDRAPRSSAASLAWIGLVVDAARASLYDYAWFVGGVRRGGDVRRAHEGRAHGAPSARDDGDGAAAGHVDRLDAPPRLPMRTV